MQIQSSRSSILVKRYTISSASRGQYVVQHSCPTCSRKIVSNLESAGKSVLCPACEDEIVVPGRTELETVTEVKLKRKTNLER